MKLDLLLLFFSSSCILGVNFLHDVSHKPTGYIPAHCPWSNMGRAGRFPITYRLTVINNEDMPASLDIMEVLSGKLSLCVSLLVHVSITNIPFFYFETRSSSETNMAWNSQQTSSQSLFSAGNTGHYSQF